MRHCLHGLWVMHLDVLPPSPFFIGAIAIVTRFQSKIRLNPIRLLRLMFLQGHFLCLLVGIQKGKIIRLLLDPLEAVNIQEYWVQGMVCYCCFKLIMLGVFYYTTCVLPVGKFYILPFCDELLLNCMSDWSCFKQLDLKTEVCKSNTIAVVLWLVVIDVWFFKGLWLQFWLWMQNWMFRRYNDHVMDLEVWCGRMRQYKIVTSCVMCIWSPSVITYKKQKTKPFCLFFCHALLPFSPYYPLPNFVFQSLGMRYSNCLYILPLLLCFSNQVIVLLWIWVFEVCTPCGWAVKNQLINLFCGW